MKDLEENILENFERLKISEDESKGILLVAFKRNSITREMEVLHNFEGNKLDVTEAIIMLLKNKEALEIQNIFEAVKEFV